MYDGTQRRLALAEGYRADLMRFARRHAANEQDLEDAVSEAILRAATADNLDETRIWSWLVSVTLRLCVDQHRRRPSADFLARLHAREAAASRVDDEVCDRAEASWLRREAGRLPDRQLAVLEMRADGLTAGQIASRLGVSYKTVESLTSRARAAMRAMLAAASAALLAWLRAAYATSRRSATPAGATALSLALAVASAAILVVIAPTPGRPAATTPETQRKDVAALPEPGQPVAANALAPSRASFRPRPRPTTTLFPGAGAGPVAVGPVETYKNEDDNRTFLEQVEDCLLHGELEISLERVGCQEPEK